jgi:hypothetical protein
VNSASIPESLIDAELFGYEGGAFTGASARGKHGRFERASGGTLFLDEIGDMPLNLQASVLRAVQNQAIVRVGGNSPLPIDTRVVCATDRDLSFRAIPDCRGNFLREGDTEPVRAGALLGARIVSRSGGLFGRTLDARGKTGVGVPAHRQRLGRTENQQDPTTLNRWRRTGLPARWDSRASCQKRSSSGRESGGGLAYSTACRAASDTAPCDD